MALPLFIWQFLFDWHIGYSSIFLSWAVLLRLSTYRCHFTYVQGYRQDKILGVLGQRVWAVLIWIVIAKLLSMVVGQAFTPARNLWRAPVSLHLCQDGMLANFQFSHSSRWKMVSGLKCTMCLNTEQSPQEPSLTHFPPGLTPVKKVEYARHWLC